MTKINVGDYLIPINEETFAKDVASRIVTDFDDFLVTYERTANDGVVVHDGWALVDIEKTFYIISPKKIEFKKQIDGL